MGELALICCGIVIAAYLIFPVPFRCCYCDAELGGTMRLVHWIAGDKCHKECFYRAHPIPPPPPPRYTAVKPQPAKPTVSIDHVERFQWKLDGSIGFKVFVDIKGQLPRRSRVMVFSAFRGWDIIRSDDAGEADRGHPVVSFGIDYNEYLIRWIDEDDNPIEPPPEQMTLIFWFHKSRDDQVTRCMPPDEINWDEHLAMVKRLVKIELH